MSIRTRSRDRQNNKRQKRSLHTFRNRSALDFSLLLEFTISLDMHGNVLDCVPRVISKDIMLTYQTNATVLLHASTKYVGVHSTVLLCFETFFGHLHDHFGSSMQHVSPGNGDECRKHVRNVLDRNLCNTSHYFWLAAALLVTECCVSGRLFINILTSPCTEQFCVGCFHSFECDRVLSDCLHLLFRLYSNSTYCSISRTLHG